MLVEELGLSGIVSILFIGIIRIFSFFNNYTMTICSKCLHMYFLQVMKHYTFSNLSENSQRFATAFFHLISSLAETFM